jgi:uncharacterized protein (TIGR02147 family)
LELNKQESEYFSYLVFFAQAKTNVDKNYYFGLIAALRSRKNITVIGPDQFDYFSEWYHPVVRELVNGKTWPLEYEPLSRLLGGKVSAAKIRKSVELLMRLGLVRLDGTDICVISSPLVNTENELKSFAVRRYHNEVLNIAKQSLDEVSPEEREISHLTVKISPRGFANIKDRIQQFREEILQIVAGDRETKDVYHVNFQFYPIAKTKDHDSR